MSQSGIPGSSHKEPEIHYGYDPTFEDTHHDEHFTDHRRGGDLYAKTMSESHDNKDYEPVIGFSKEEAPSYVHFTLPKRRHGHKHLYYEIMESSSEYGFTHVYGDLVDGYGCTDMSANVNANIDSGQFEPIIGFRKEEL